MSNEKPKIRPGSPATEETRPPSKPGVLADYQGGYQPPASDLKTTDVKPPSGGTGVKPPPKKD